MIFRFKLRFDFYFQVQTHPVPVISIFLKQRESLQAGVIFWKKQVLLYFVFLLLNKFAKAIGALGMGFTSVLFGAFGALGYFAFGEETKDIITTNLGPDVISAMV